MLALFFSHGGCRMFLVHVSLKMLAFISILQSADHPTNTSLTQSQLYMNAFKVFNKKMEMEYEKVLLIEPNSPSPATSQQCHITGCRPQILKFTYMECRAETTVNQLVAQQKIICHLLR